MNFKTIIVVLVFLTGTLPLCSFQAANPVVSRPENVLIRIPATSEKNFSLIKNAIESSPSTTVTGYCSVYSIFIVSYDPTQTDPDSIIRNIINTNQEFKCEVKSSEGFTLEAGGCIVNTPANTNVR